MSDARDPLCQAKTVNHIAISVSDLARSRDWYRETFDPLLQSARALPFFFAWRPQDYSDEVGYCWLTANARPVNQRNNGMMSITLPIAGIV